MNKAGQNCRTTKKNGKYRILVFPFYILFYVVFIIVLGLGVGDVWDRLIKWTKR